MNEVDLSENIARLAPLAATIATELESAIDAERNAEAGVLRRAIDLARPALKSIVGKLKKSSTSFNDGSRSDEVEWFEWRGTVIAGELSPVVRDYPSNNNGKYDAQSALVLRSNGTLVQCDRGGTWSRWSNGRCVMETDASPITIRESMDRWELKDCLAAIETQLRGVIDGQAAKTAEESRKRAERLRALILLVG